MASERPTNEPVRPAGAEGDGMDRYPTYRDGPETPHRVTATKPTDVGLPRSRRTFALPLLIGLAVFALVIIIRVVWGSMNMAGTADEALSPGRPASAPINAPATGAGAPAAETQGTEAPGTLDRDVEADSTTGAGDVEATPGGADVPGGTQTESPTGQPAAPAR